MVRDGVVGTPSQRDTFSKDVVRILQAHCQSCHHEGDIAPFPLVTYQDAYEHRSAMQYMTAQRLMPPWHVDSSCSDFQGNPSLTDDEIRAIDRWVKAGGPEGDPRDLPPPLVFSSGYKLGTPDKELAMSQAFTPDFSKGDVYRCFVLPTNLSQDTYLSSAEVLPGVRSMVHHVLLFTDTTGAADRLDADDPAPGYACFGGPGFASGGPVGAWVPGARQLSLPDGVGTLIPKGSRLVMQVHYSARSGVVSPDLTKVGFYYAKGHVTKMLRWLPFVNTTFRIPAGNPSYTVTQSIPNVITNVHLVGIAPHMHLLGQTMKVEVTDPHGAKKCLVNVPDYDFRWQGGYLYKQAVPIVSGTSMKLTAVYDNSSQNPENPNSPPKDVTWGEQTSDEMCLCYLLITVDSENLSAGPAGAFHGRAW